ncbi:hypothetical protein SNEBB_007486 [Seison nebaliae]|nr:hypothetical protein SNEBB_007486 [Seison nebaliae]
MDYSTNECHTTKNNIPIMFDQDVVMVGVPYIYEHPNLSLSLSDLRICNHIGHGTSGEVYTAYFMNEPQKMLAVKIFKHNFCERHTRSELSVWRTLSNNEDIVESLNDISFHNSPLVCAFSVKLKSKLNVITTVHFLVTVYGECGTLEFLKDYTSKNYSITEIKWFAIQLLHLIKKYHSKGYIHGDLKTFNIIINRQGHIKLIDYGSTTDLICKFIPKYSFTLGYRAPETSKMVLKGSTIAADYWAIGTILFKLLTGEMIGNYMWPKFEHEMIKLENKKRMKLKDCLDDDPVAYDFMDKLLEFNPNKRAKSDILQHSFFDDYFGMTKASDIIKYQVPSSLIDDLDEIYEENLLNFRKAKHLSLDEFMEKSQKVAN